MMSTLDGDPCSHAIAQLFWLYRMHIASTTLQNVGSNLVGAMIM